MRGRRTVRRFASIGIVALALGARAQSAEAPSPVTRVHAIATGIAACWRPPHDDDQVTVRISFTREGAVIGEPRIVFVRSSGGRADDAALARSMMAAIRDCTPLQFLRSARRGDRGSGSEYSLHRSQPGDHRRPTLMNCRPASLYGVHTKSNSRYLFKEFREAVEFSCCVKRGRKIQAKGRKIKERGKQNPSLSEEKSKLFPSANSSLFKELRRPLAFFGLLRRNKIKRRMCNWRARPRIAVRGSTAVSVLVTLGLAKRSDHGVMNHLSGDRTIRRIYSESQEDVDELWLTAFAMARRARPPRVWPREGRQSRTPLRDAWFCGAADPRCNDELSAASQSRRAARDPLIRRASPATFSRKGRRGAPRRSRSCEFGSLHMARAALARWPSELRARCSEIALVNSPDLRVSAGCFEGRRRDSMAPGGGAMFGRVLFVTILGVAVTLLGSFALVERLPAPAPVSSPLRAPSRRPASRPMRRRRRRPSANHPATARPCFGLTGAANMRPMRSSTV